MEKKQVLVLMDPGSNYSLRIGGRIMHFGFLKHNWVVYGATISIGTPNIRIDFEKMDGIIGFVVNKNTLKNFSSLNKPFINLIHTDLSFNIPYIITNDESIAVLAADHIREKFVNNVAFAGYTNSLFSNNRLAKFKRYTSSINMKWRGEYLLPMSKIYEYGITHKSIDTSYAEWLTLLPTPIGILCANDKLAYYTIEVCRIIGGYIPGEIMVIGVDNDDIICNSSYIPITSIYHNIDRIASVAVENMNKLLEGGSVSKVTQIPAGGIIERRSTGYADIKNPYVNKALEIIRNEYLSIKKIDDIIPKIGCSKSVIMRLFRNYVGMSMTEYITSLKLAYAKKLLRTTDESIAEIAEECNYTLHPTFTRWFIKKTGISPLRYRKLFMHAKTSETGEDSF